MGTSVDEVGPLKRLAYALIGLVAGNAMLLLYLVQNALRVRSTLLAARMGEPAQALPNAVQYFLFLRPSRLRVG